MYTFLNVLMFKKKLKYITKFILKKTYPRTHVSTIVLFVFDIIKLYQLLFVFFNSPTNLFQLIKKKISSNRFNFNLFILKYNYIKKNDNYKYIKKKPICLNKFL